VTRILVVDDHELVRCGIQSTLENQFNFEICGIAVNGQEAIDKVLELKPDLVILDLSMPVLSGFQAALKIRYLAPAVKILIFSIHEAALVEQVAYLMGAHGYLRKSATSRELISTIRSVLEGNPAALPVGTGDPSSVPDRSESR
jgi:DNA-binding NarL/FixJ family response regulator